jgi:hypothetical protein
MDTKKHCPPYVADYLINFNPLSVNFHDSLAKEVSQVTFMNHPSTIYFSYELHPSDNLDDQIYYRVINVITSSGRHFKFYVMDQFIKNYYVVNFAYVKEDLFSIELMDESEANVYYDNIFRSEDLNDQNSLVIAFMDYEVEEFILIKINDEEVTCHYLKYSDWMRGYCYSYISLEPVSDHE